MAEATSVAENLRAVREEVERAARAAGRDPAGVRVLAVTKTVPPGRIREAYEAGARLFGENYVQEALGKVEALPPDAEWHMIGHLQSNKAKRAVEVFTTVQSVDRPSLANALQREAAKRGVRVDALVQVNLAGEETKSGAAPEAALDLLRRAPEWPNLRVRGLMAIPPYLPDPEAVRPHFRALREFRDRIRELALPGVSAEELSMGMSHDFAVAVEEGATLVRVGTAVFGERA